MVQEQDKEMEVFNQFLLSESEQENFKKMISKYTDIYQLAKGIGLYKNNTMKAFDYTERVENAGRPSERTIRTPKTQAVRNWKNLMNKYGWSWVNENIYLMACNDIVFPTSVIEKIMDNYNLKFKKLPPTKIISEEIRTSMQ